MKNKIKKSLLVALLANILTLNGCIQEIEDLEIEDLIEENDLDIQKVEELAEVKEEVREDNIQEVSDKTIEELQKSFSTDITFKNQAYYNDIKYFDPVTRLECKNTFDGDVSKIIDKIEGNSISYALENNEKSWFDDNYDKAITRIFLEDILNNIVTTSSNINEDMHTISKIKLINGNNVFTIESNKMSVLMNIDAKYNTNNHVIRIDRDSLYNDNLLDNEVSENIFENNYYASLYETINEARLETCEEVNNIDSIYDGEELLNTLAQGAAKSNTYYNNKSGYSQCSAYFKDDNDVRDEAKLLTLALLSDEENATDKYYNALFEEDYETLYKIFNLHTQEDILNFKKIILAMDSKNLKNDYLVKHGSLKDMCDVEEYVGYDYRILLHNMVVNNLIKKQSNISLEDNLVLYHLMFSTIVKDSYIDKYDLDLEIYDKTFVSKMYALYNNYMDYLKLSYKVDDEKFNIILEDSLIKMDGLYLANVENKGTLNVLNFMDMNPFSKIILNSTNISSDTHKEFFEKNELTLKK